MNTASLLITLGLIFLLGLAADQLGRLTHLPRVTMLLLIGLIAGESGFALFGPDLIAWFDIIAIVALTMVAFLLGSSLSWANLAAHGRAILVISLSVVLVTAGLVGLGMMAVGVRAEMALVLGAIATATAPAAVTDVIRQAGISNSFTRTLQGIVAIDDAWGLILFSLVLAFAMPSGNTESLLLKAGTEIGGALLLGLAVGLPASFLTGRISAGEPLQAEAIGIVFLTAGLALWLEISFLVAGIVAGCVIANGARHHERAFHEIEHVQWPFLILFFLLAGASLEISEMVKLGLLTLAYILLRISARVIGGWVGAVLAGIPAGGRACFGPALLPQAGVAVGMALVAGESLPQFADAIMALTLAATVVFELLGPPITYACVKRSE